MIQRKHFLEVEAKAIKAADGGKITLQGYANKNIIDSYNERVDPAGINLSRFRQNPILLFNHDMDYPIGKVLKVEPREDGVWVEAEISNSDSERIKYVRDLIEDQSLRTFSIGFMVDDGEEHEDGYYVIKNWTLHELSVESIPANEESTFSAERKDLRGMALTMKRAEVRVNNSETVEEAAKIAGVSLRRLTGIIQGVEKPNAEILSAIEKAFDVAIQSDEENPAPEGDRVEQLKDMQQCVADKIPKLIEEGKPQDEAVATAIAMCSEEGDKTLTEEEKSWLSEQMQTRADYQTEVPNDDMPNPTLFADMAKSINAMMGELIGIGKEVALELRATRELIARMVESEEKPDSIEDEDNGSMGIDSQDENKPDEGERLFYDRIDAALKRFGV